MNKEFQIERHKTLWQEKTKQAKRIVYAGLLFGVWILFNVLTPYSNYLPDKNKIELELKPHQLRIEENEKYAQQLNAIIKQRNASKKILNTFLQRFNDMEKRIKDIKMFFTEAPWETETQKLIKKFREMNIRGGAGWDEYQAEADTTIYSVADLVKRKVVEPLSGFSDILNNPKIDQELKTISETVNKWVEENIGERWYLTVEGKESRINEFAIVSVSEPVVVTLNSFVREINRNKHKLIARLNQAETKLNQAETKLNQLKAKENQLKTEVKELKDKPKYKENTEELAQLQAKMDKGLPELLRGMISVEQMVQTFPFAVVFLAAYALSTALSAASHYRVLVRELNLEEAGFTDPSFSSLWALTYRGRYGTLLTIGVYTIFTLAMWFFFESGSDILLIFLKNRDAWFINKDTFPIIFWLCRMLLVMLIPYIAIHPYYTIRKIHTMQAR